jgi:NADH:ubiquinone oxidoreductase subunit 6 (subunit J)
VDKSEPPGLASAVERIPLVEPSIWIAQAALLGSAFVLLALALHVKDLIRAIAAFATGSALIAASFFLLDAPFAGALELTVGAGLVAVLFLVAVTLTGGREEPEATP